MAAASNQRLTGDGRYRRLAAAGLAACLLAVTTPLPAWQEPLEEAPEEPRRYAVEIILFRYADSVSAGNEVFPPEPPPVETFELYGPPPAGSAGGSESGGEADPLPADDLADLPVREYSDRVPGQEPLDETDIADAVLSEIILPANRVELQVTPREELQLQEVFDKLELLDAYQPVFWSGWSQAAVDAENSPLIALRRLGNPPIEFDGTLQLYLSRFLHLVVDVTLTPRDQQRNGTPALPEPAAVYGDNRTQGGRAGLEPLFGQSQGLVHMTINEDRIVKSDDLRYFDHPRFGLLAKITRVEQEEPDTDSEANGDGELLPAAR